jgi:hypothetical protein
MTRAYLSAAFTGVLVALLALGGVAQSSDSQVGTWKLHFDKSTYRDGAVFQTATVKISL